eukprot:9330301-Pyramimonas_sp.AAC.1
MIEEAGKFFTKENTRDERYQALQAHRRELLRRRHALRLQLGALDDTNDGAQDWDPVAAALLSASPSTQEVLPRDRASHWELPASRGTQQRLDWGEFGGHDTQGGGTCATQRHSSPRPSTQ